MGWSMDGHGKQEIGNGSGNRKLGFGPSGWSKMMNTDDTWWKWPIRTSRAQLTRSLIWATFLKSLKPPKIGLNVQWHISLSVLNFAPRYSNVNRERECHHNRSRKGNWPYGNGRQKSSSSFYDQQLNSKIEEWNNLILTGGKGQDIGEHRIKHLLVLPNKIPGCETSRLAGHIKIDTLRSERTADLPDRVQFGLLMNWYGSHSGQILSG